MSGLKIAFVLDDSLDKTDGVQQYIITLGNWLSDQGHEVHYLVGQTARSDIPNIHSLSRNVAVRFNQNRLSVPLPVNSRKVSALLAAEDFDVLHIQMPYSPMLAAKVIAVAPRRTAVIGTFHILPFAWVERVGTRLLGLVLRRTIKRFDKVFSVSDPAADFAKAAFGVESTVLPNVVTLARFQPAKSISKAEGSLKVVFLGRLVERKGCRQLLEALVSLKDKELPGYSVQIGGTGPLEGELKAFSKAHGLDSLVEFRGFINEEDKPAFLAQADIAVFPSLGGESFGIVLIEAMAAGAGVVLAGDNPGYVSVMRGRPEQVIQPRQTAAFAEKVEYFLTNPEARLAARDWQAAHVQQFDTAVVGNQLVDTYKQVIAKNTKADNN